VGLQSEWGFATLYDAETGHCGRWEGIPKVGGQLPRPAGKGERLVRRKNLGDKEGM